MKEDQLTPWFPAEVKPVHVGEYEVKRFYMDGSPMEPHRLYWDGKSWSYAYRFCCSKRGDYASVSKRDGDKWRGLRSKP